MYLCGEVLVENRKKALFIQYFIFFSYSGGYGVICSMAKNNKRILLFGNRELRA